MYNLFTLLQQHREHLAADMVVLRLPAGRPFSRLRHRPLVLACFCTLVCGLVFLLQTQAQSRRLAADDFARRLSIAQGHGLDDAVAHRRPLPLGAAASQGPALGFADTKEELAALLAFVTATTANSLPALDPNAVLDPYLILDFDPAGQGAAADLDLLVHDIYALYPLIIVGKMRDPWHLGLKRLFATLGITPTALIVDVDQRRDHDVFIPLLARLLGTQDLPQVILRGEVIGSYPEILQEAKDHSLVRRLEAAGLTVVHRAKAKGAKEWERLENERVLGPAPIVAE